MTPPQLGLRLQREVRYLRLSPHIGFGISYSLEYRTSCLRAASAAKSSLLLRKQSNRSTGLWILCLGHARRNGKHVTWPQAFTSACSSRCPNTRGLVESCLCKVAIRLRCEAGFKAVLCDLATSFNACYVWIVFRYWVHTKQVKNQIL
jgi:hypothetical protein